MRFMTQFLQALHWLYTHPRRDNNRGGVGGGGERGPRRVSGTVNKDKYPIRSPPPLESLLWWPLVVKWMSGWVARVQGGNGQRLSGQ